MPTRPSILAVCFAISFLSLVLARAAELAEPQAPVIAKASDEGQEALAGFRIPGQLEGRLFAAEPLLANPVAFYVDHQGRFFVCESFRQNQGVTDNRGHDEAWLNDDLAARTVEDRRAYHLKHLGEEAVTYTTQDDRIRLVEDRDGDGRAETATVFADHFNDLVDGTGAGVLFHGGKVYYTCIPHLWLLRDQDGDGRSDERKSLHYGYGVRVAFRGHDSHGLIVGPDGRLYFSIGDRGYNITTDDGRRLVDPSSGAVFRCNLDGSQLEVVATGLRNPQELAFDDYGNLFTGDNNSDSGDRARLVYVVEGSDSGWRMEYQYLSDRGPFNRERIWHPHHEGQPAYIVPPIDNLADGPSGLAFYPGTGLPDHYRDRFFLCDFRGGPANSGIRTFRVKPQGAFFQLADQEETLWNILATDVAFGPNGSLYVTDWVDGWNGEGKGRIYEFYSAEQQQTPLVQQVHQLLKSDDFRSQTSEQLEKLLAHADRRVRQEAQFALAARRDVATLSAVAAENAELLARLHAVWGLGQIAREAGERPEADDMRHAAADAMLRLLEADDDEVQAQAARVAGDARIQAAWPQLLTLLDSANARVQYFAAQALGKLGRQCEDAQQAVPALLRLLEQNEDRDPVVRHGAVMGLVGTASPDQLAKAASHASRSVRLGAVVALRRMESPVVAEYLEDTDPLVVTEAARAIHDLPIAEALPQLAAVRRGLTQSEPLLRRVLNANFRLGGAEHAAAVADNAARSDISEPLRLEALEMLANWQQPSPRDRVLNKWRPLPERDEAIAARAMSDRLAGIFAGPPAVRDKAAQVAAALGVKQVGPVLREMFADREQPEQSRADALRALAALGDERLAESVGEALTDPAAAVRAAGREVLAKQDPAAGIPELKKGLSDGTLVERQSALRTLAELEHPEAEAAVSEALDQLLAGNIPADTQLDVLEAAAALDTPELVAKVTRYEQSKPADDPLAAYREALAGGDVDRGRKIFFERTQVSCVRCHKIDGVGGEVGPDLSKIGREKQRDYLLEAVVDPNKAIAKNFETVMLADDEGQIHSGIVKAEDDEQIQIMTAEGKLVTLDQDRIEARRAGKSPMPEDVVKQLSKADLRDLVEFLSSLR